MVRVCVLHSQKRRSYSLQKLNRRLIPNDIQGMGPGKGAENQSQRKGEAAHDDPVLIRNTLRRMFPVLADLTP
jgi:hypothetical protein